MAFEPRDNSGVLFVNDRKDKDSHPDRTGTALIEGREYWVSGWIKHGAKGQFMSLAFKPKDGGLRRPEPAGQRANVAPNARDRRSEEFNPPAPAGSYAEALDDEVPW